MFVNEKDKAVAELSDEKWLWDLVLLYGTSHYSCDLNAKLQGQQNLSELLKGC
jgi:hypothetical protein